MYRALLWWNAQLFAKVILRKSQIASLLSGDKNLNCIECWLKWNHIYLGRVFLYCPVLHHFAWIQRGKRTNSLKIILCILHYICMLYCYFNKIFKVLICFISWYRLLKRPVPVNIRRLQTAKKEIKKIKPKPYSNVSLIHYLHKIKYSDSLDLQWKLK